MPSTALPLQNCNEGGFCIKPADKVIKLTLDKLTQVEIYGLGMK